jgi:hypothetical protein
MALQVDGVLPTEIKVVKNGTTTDLTVLKTIKNGVETAVWGKPFSLILNGTDCTVSAQRNTSPNEHATTGVALSSGSKIYYGDVIKIAVAPSGVQYTLSSVKINGTEQLSSTGQTAFEKEITVTSAITVSAIADKTVKSWNTMWTGSKATTINQTLANNPIEQEYPTTGNTTSAVALSTFGITKDVSSFPIRITGTVSVGVGGSSVTTTNNTTLSAKELTTSYAQVTNKTSTTVGSYTVTGYVSMSAVSSNLNYRFYMTKGKNLARATGQAVVTITKVEQYY